MPKQQQETFEFSEKEIVEAMDAAWDSNTAFDAVRVLLRVPIPRYATGRMMTSEGEFQVSVRHTDSSLRSHFDKLAEAEKEFEEKSEVASRLMGIPDGPFES